MGKHIKSIKDVRSKVIDAQNQEEGRDTEKEDHYLEQDDLYWRNSRLYSEVKMVSQYFIHVKQGNRTDAKSNDRVSASHQPATGLLNQEPYLQAARCVLDFLLRL